MQWISGRVLSTAHAWLLGIKEVKHHRGDNLKILNLCELVIKIIKDFTYG